ncbi:MAG: alpha/beta hydrolase [Faecalibacterium sp.]
MKTQKLKLDGVPALLIGAESQKVFLYVHGKLGCKEEALDFAEQACPAGYQVLAIDLPEHGERKAEEAKLLPWNAVPEIQRVYRWMSLRWNSISLRATSIGAWMSMLALQEERLEQTLLVSPIVEMPALIYNMMDWAGITEVQLEQTGKIPTAFGETLSWAYLCWARKNPLYWQKKTAVLYTDGDDLTGRAVIDRFCRESGAVLTVMEQGEHWFHTPEQMEVLHRWERQNLT